MKKIIKILFLSFVVIFIILSISLWVFLKNFDFNQFKPQILAASQKALSKPVDFNNLSFTLSLVHGLGIKINDLVIKNDNLVNNLFYAKSLYIKLDIKKIIFKKEINILGIECNNFEINIIAQEEKEAKRITEQINPDKPDAYSQASLGESKEKPKVKNKIENLFIKDIKITEGRVNYINHNEIETLADKISGHLENFLFNDYFSVKVQARLISNQDNLFLTTKAKVEVNFNQFDIKDLKINLDLKSIDLDSLTKLTPQTKDIVLKKVNSGNLLIEINKLNISALGIEEVNGQLLLEQGELLLKSFIVPVTIDKFKIKFDKDKILLGPSWLNLAKGKIRVWGVISDFLTIQNYWFKILVNDLNLSQIIDQAQYQIKAEGLVNGDFQLKGQGLGVKKILTNLQGQGGIKINQAKLVDINILRLVLEKISFLPNLVQDIELNLPLRFKQALSDKDTPILNFQSDLGIANQQIYINKLDLATYTFSFQASGSMSFMQEYNLQGHFVIPQDLSLAIIKSVPELQYLMNQAQELSFPLKVLGQGTKVAFVPDVRQITVNAIKQKGLEELEKVLEKVLPDDQVESPANNVKESDSNNKKQVKKEAIKAIIGAIFKE